MAKILVEDKFRKNPLSVIEGGQEVTVVWQDGTEHVYDKVKSPSAYVSRISKKASSHGLMMEVRVNNGIVWRRDDKSVTTQAWLDFLAK